MKKYVIILVIFLATCAMAGPAAVHAQDDNSSSAEVDGQAVALKGTIVEVGGMMVQVRHGADQPWLAAKKGMELTQGAEFRTGPRCYVKFVIEPNQLVVLDRLGTIKILEAVRDADMNKVKTDLGMKYGRTRYDVEAAGTEHESTIHSPNATLAVRGTDAQIEDEGGQPVRITSYHGEILATLSGFKAVAMGKKIKTSIDQSRPVPADHALGETSLNAHTAFAGDTQTEQELVEQMPNMGGYDPVMLDALADALDVTIDDTFGGTVASENSLFVLASWQGGTPMVTDVDLNLHEPEGFNLTAYSPVSPNGGIHNGNVISGMTGSGIESALYALDFPEGTYNIRLDLTTTTSMAVGFFQVVVNDIPVYTSLPITLNMVTPSHSEDIDIYKPQQNVVANQSTGFQVMVDVLPTQE